MVHCSGKINDFAPSLQRVCPKGRQIVLYLSFSHHLLRFCELYKLAEDWDVYAAKNNLTNFYGLHQVDLTNPATTLPRLTLLVAKLTLSVSKDLIE